MTGSFGIGKPAMGPAAGAWEVLLDGWKLDPYKMSGGQLVIAARRDDTPSREPLVVAQGANLDEALADLRRRIEDWNG